MAFSPPLQVAADRVGTGAIIHSCLHAVIAAADGASASPCPIVTSKPEASYASGASPAVPAFGRAQIDADGGTHVELCHSCFQLPHLSLRGPSEVLDCEMRQGGVQSALSLCPRAPSKSVRPAALHFWTSTNAARPRTGALPAPPSHVTETSPPRPEGQTSRTVTPRHYTGVILWTAAAGQRVPL